MEALPSRHRTAAALRWAAAICLTLGAAGAAAMLGLPQFVEARRDPSAIEAAPAAGASSAGGAIAIEPADGAFVLALENVGADTRITLGFYEEEDVSIEIGASASTRFRAARGAVTADLRGTSATVHVRVPTALRIGILRVDGHPIASFAEGGLRRLREAAGVTLSPAEVR